jgi:hypothetical protein
MWKGDVIFLEMVEDHILTMATIQGWHCKNGIMRLDVNSCDPIKIEGSKKKLYEQ